MKTIATNINRQFNHRCGFHEGTQVQNLTRILPVIKLCKFQIQYPNTVWTFSQWKTHFGQGQLGLQSLAPRSSRCTTVGGLQRFPDFYLDFKWPLCRIGWDEIKGDMKGGGQGRDCTLIIMSGTDQQQRI